jgi:hypothetical protein
MVIAALVNNASRCVTVFGVKKNCIKQENDFAGTTALSLQPECAWMDAP